MTILTLTHNVDTAKKMREIARIVKNSNAKIGKDLQACGISTLKCRGQFSGNSQPVNDRILKE